MLSAGVKRKILIKKWPEKLAEVNNKFLPKAGIVALGTAKRLAPIDLGILHGSLNYQVGKDQVTIGTNINYAAHVEYGHKTRSMTGPQKPQAFSITKGTGFVAAQPYLRPAIDKNRKKLVALWKGIYRRVYGGR